MLVDKDVDKAGMFAGPAMALLFEPQWLRAVVVFVVVIFVVVVKPA